MIFILPGLNYENSNIIFLEKTVIIDSRISNLEINSIMEKLEKKEKMEKYLSFTHLKRY
jgi:hypothetical protein